MLHTSGCYLAPAGAMLLPYVCRCQSLYASSGQQAGLLIQAAAKISSGSAFTSSSSYICECGKSFIPNDDSLTPVDASTSVLHAGSNVQHSKSTASLTVSDATIQPTQHAESTVKRLETRIAALQAESGSLSAQVTAAAINLETNNSTLLAKNTNLQGQITAGGMTIVNLATTNASLMAENSSLQAQIAAASAVATSLESSNSMLVTQNADLRLEIAAGEKDLTRSETSKAALQTAANARITVLENLISHMQQIITAPTLRMQGPLQPQTDAECIAALVASRDDAILQVSKLAGKVRREEHKVLLLESAAETAILQASISAAQITLLEMVIQRVTVKNQKQLAALGPTPDMLEGTEGEDLNTGKYVNDCTYPYLYYRWSYVLLVSREASNLLTNASRSAEWKFLVWNVHMFVPNATLAPSIRFDVRR